MRLSSLITTRLDYLNRHFRGIEAGVLAMSDALMIFVGFTLGFWVRSFSGLFPPGVIPYTDQCFLLIPWLVLIWVLTAPAFDISLYRSGYTWTHLLIKVAEAALLATAISLIFNQFSGVRYSRLAIVAGWTISLVLIGVARYVIFLGTSLLRLYGIGVVKVAIVGYDPSVPDIVETTRANPDLGYRITGIIADGPDLPTALPAPLLGSIDQIKDLVRKHSVDELIIALPHAEREKTLNILAEFETAAITVRIVSSVIDSLARAVEVGQIGNRRLLALREHPLNGWRGAAKRVLDFAVSLTALALLSPLFGAIAILVKLTSPGPVFYRQIRVGRDDKPFTMFKFRSMRADAEATTGAVWAAKNDDRCTVVGRILRRLSLDELPQLYNVLVGQMSLVGPRPERPSFVEEFKKQMPAYLRRHKVKAGITGWAQAQGWRGNTSLEKRIQCDLWYIANWSLSLDFEIMLKTIREVFGSRNAC